ncbi:MAG: AgmX/PglI C-terminal domain-containing protein [Myxococcales bacterium]|nr:AgmX/PglI C-terminal domain-containing protein [Myxococcales bacterium]
MTKRSHSSPRDLLGPTLAVVGFALLGACGGTEGPKDNGLVTERWGDAEEKRPADDGLAVTGLMGTLDADEIRAGLDPRMGKFQRCFIRGYDDVDVLGGQIDMTFHVNLDGTVAWVFPIRSNVGHRGVEKCIVDVAKGARFPEPRGGEAEFSWPLAMDPPEDVRPAVPWNEDALGDARTEYDAAVRACGRLRADVQVTLYIAPGGQVLQAGASTPDRDTESRLDCIVEAARSMVFADPGSYPAKAVLVLKGR